MLAKLSWRSQSSTAVATPQILDPRLEIIFGVQVPQQHWRHVAAPQQQLSTAAIALHVEARARASLRFKLLLHTCYVVKALTPTYNYFGLFPFDDDPPPLTL